jgi:hypothetical protein
MYKKYKSEIKEIIEIVKECPESLQEKCFEILLNKLLEDEKPSQDQKITPSNSENESEDINGDSSEGMTGSPEEYEISLFDLHVKTQKFLQENDISIERMNELFYKENEEIEPLYEDLNCTQLSECQMRLALLTGLQNSLFTGDFKFDVENVRDRCKNYKCYDGPNYIANYRNNEKFWDNFSDYKEEEVKISTDGKIELANIIKDIS